MVEDKIRKVWGWDLHCLEGLVTCVRTWLLSLHHLLISFRTGSCLLPHVTVHTLYSSQWFSNWGRIRICWGVKTRLLWLTLRVSVLGLRVCNADGIPGDSDAADTGATL